MSIDDEQIDQHIEKKHTTLSKNFLLYSEKRYLFFPKGGGGKRPGDTTGKREEMKNKDDDEGYRSETIPDDEKNNK